MNTNDTIYQYIKDWFQSASVEEAERGIDASQISAQLGIWQTDVTRALNALCADHRIRKKGARPARYFLENENDKAKTSHDDIPAFQRIIGYNGSLTLQIQLAKAGASYPPHGMHMLLIGESGVGKTLMAEEIWRHINQSQEEGKPDVPFVIFNCAEYAENPQFLLSQLFGYVKGAFTGADCDYQGLVEQVDGGVLFLDEIHRLPATGQEMLFTLLDRGLYRRMGSSRDSHAQLLVIGATTESPEAAFLKTYRRRIPMVIEIPALSERPMKEKLALIFHFISIEAKRLNLPIKISPHALCLLISYQSDTNIGDLKNEIQLCCARGYLFYCSQTGEDELRLPYIEFNSGNLSRNLQGVRISSDAKQYIDAYISHNSLIVTPNESPSSDLEEGQNSSNLYTFIEERLSSYKDENLEPQEIGQLVSLDIQSRYVTSSQDDDSGLHLYDSVTSDVIAAANELLRLASNRFHYIYPDVICNTLALFLQQIKFQAAVNQAYSFTGIHMLDSAVEEKKRFVLKMSPMLNKALNISLTDDEAIIIALLLDTNDPLTDRKRVGLVLMGHGNTTASSIADFTNQVLLARIAHAVDMPIQVMPEQALEQLCEKIQNIDEGRGVIVLTDTDNFEYYQKQILDRTGIRCRVIPCLSTAMSLDICKAILTTDDDMDTIFRKSVASYKSYILASFERASENYTPSATPDAGRSVIITSCITGTGSARRIREWLLQFPNIYMNAEIIPVGMLHEDIQELAQRLGDRLKLVIGFMNPKIKGVPFISVEKVTSQEGINRISLILKGWESTDFNTDWSQEELPLHIRFNQIAQKISYFAPSLEPNAVAQQTDNIIRQVRRLCTKELPDDLQVRMYIHLVTMFERLHSQEPMPMPEDETGIIARNPEFFEQLKAILQTACDNLHLHLQPSEAYYFLLALPLDEIL
ncbi:MAG: sigma 54-interacting transcriptional regulator [Lachnospiraceae bacterium]|nr:sigma 54-interacting transcriptional regulator [Lachnospiraceae bacterium]